MNTKQKDFNVEHEILLRKVFNGFSHDLKTPLACIVGSLQIIEKMKADLTPEQVDSLINTALAEANRLDGMISKMLEEAKPA